MKYELNDVLSVIKILIEKGKLNPVHFLYEHFSIAVNSGDTEIVKLLLPHVYPGKADGWAITVAARRGYLDIVKLLLPKTDLDSRECSAHKRAAESGNLECLKVLGVADYKYLDELIITTHSATKECREWLVEQYQKQKAGSRNHKQEKENGIQQCKEIAPE